VNEPPTIALANVVTSLVENTDTTSRVKVADIVVTDDALGTNELSLSGMHAALFEVDPTEIAGSGTAGLYLKAGTTLDFETTPVLEVIVVVDNADVGRAPDGTVGLVIPILDANEAPVVVDDAATTDEDTPVTLSAASLLDNDTDPDADTLSIGGIDSTGTRGLVIDNGNGTYTYDPNGQFHYLAVGESTTDSFTYTVSDGRGGTAIATATVTITGASDLTIDKYSVRSSKIPANNCCKMSGSFDIPGAEVVAGERIHVRILVPDGSALFDEVITIRAADLRQGVYTYRTSLPKGSSGAVTLLKLDTTRHTFELWVEGLDLSGLSYPLTLKLTVDDYLGSGQTR